MKNQWNILVEVFVLHSIGMSVNVHKLKQYYEMNYDWTQKGMDVSTCLFIKQLNVGI